MQTKINPIIAVISGVIAVSFSAVFVKISLNNGTPAIIIAMYRLLFSSLFLFPFVVCSKYKLNEIKLLTKKQFILCLLSAMFLALHFICWMSSLKFTSTFGSVVLVCMQPVFVVIFSYLLFGETVNKWALIGIIIALFGSICIGIKDIAKDGGYLTGDILALLGAVFVAGYFLCGKKLREFISSISYSFIVYAISALILFYISTVFIN